jgi:hypothetical protein
LRLRLWAALLLGLGVMSQGAAQSMPDDTDESAYAPSTLAKIMGGAARSQNDEAELGPNGAWYSTTATFTGAKRQPSGRFRPLISSWVSSRGETGDITDLYFSGDLPELQFEQAGKKYWLMSGLPAGLGFDIYPPGQKLTGERLSEPVDIDNTPPVVKAMGQPQLKGDSVHMVFSVDDATGKVKKADASLDGAAWLPV